MSRDLLNEGVDPDDDDFVTYGNAGYETPEEAARPCPCSTWPSFEGPWDGERFHHPMCLEGRIEEGVTRASLSVAAEIEEQERRGEWRARPKGKLPTIEDVDGSDVDRVVGELIARGGADATLGRFLRAKVCEHLSAADPESCVSE